MTNTPPTDETPARYWHDKAAEAKEKKRRKVAKASAKVNHQRANRKKRPTSSKRRK